MRFELLDDATERVGVGDNVLLVHQPMEQRRVLRGAQTDAVAGKSHGAILRQRRRRTGESEPGHCGRRRTEAAHLQKSTPV
jgi:hypothetical protein